MQKKPRNHFYMSNFFLPRISFRFHVDPNGFQVKNYRKASFRFLASFGQALLTSSIVLFGELSACGQTGIQTIEQFFRKT